MTDPTIFNGIGKYINFPILLKIDQVIAKRRFFCNFTGRLGLKIVSVLRRSLFSYLFLFLFSWISGCATAPRLPPAPTVTTVPVEKGVYHTVSAGETLWRIAKTYGVSISDIVRNNSIPNVTQIDKDQRIFIPGAEQAKKIVLERDPKDSEFIWPIRGKVISHFGERKGLKVNRGIDIQGKEGEPLQASRSGKVVFADYLGGYANTLIVDHLDGYYSVYAQNGKLLAKLDDVIAQGAPIAEIGKHNGSSYLHFEIRKRSTADNPLYYLP